MAHSKMAGAISYAKVKTDKVDAKTLAELLRARPDCGGLPDPTRPAGASGTLRVAVFGWSSGGGSCSRPCGTSPLNTMCRSVVLSGAIREKLQQWLAPLQLPPAAGLPAQLPLEQISQLQQHIHRIEEEIEDEYRLKPPPSG
ncbi:MAG: hypothetical protein U5K69_13725 [Balneolaceae bacterium]|nr:hypothetical protein [Balneolaceae bacterium]